MLAVAMLLSSRGAFADDKHDFVDGNEVLKKCTPLLTSFDSGKNGDLFALIDGMYCTGWIAGIRDLNSLYEGLVKQPLFCQQEGISNAQFIRIVLKYLREHPEKLDQPAIVLTAQAMQVALPCK
jgi:hypothetical protein